MARSQLIKLVFAAATLLGLLAIWTASPAHGASAQDDTGRGALVQTAEPTAGP